jgi:nitrogen fixation protein FixH
LPDDTRIDDCAKDNGMATPTPRPLSGRTVLLSLIGFFAVVIGANAALTVFAIQTLPGTEVASSYKAGLGYNGEIAAARSQEARHWRVAAHVERDPDGRARLSVEAREASGSPATGLFFKAVLERPIDKRADQEVALAERGSGIYRGEALGVASGQWDLVLTAERGTERVFLSKNRVVLK